MQVPEQPSGLQPHSYVITLLAKPWKPDAAAHLLQSLRQYASESTSSAPAQIAGADTWSQLITVPAALPDDARQQLASAADQSAIDLFIETRELFHTPRKLFAFDMDSTVIQAEVIDELAALNGAKAEVSAITASAMRGEIDFPTSLRRRVAKLKGLREERFEELYDSIQLGIGMEALMKGLKRTGCKTAIISGGFGFFGRYVQQKLGFDYLYANELEIKDGALTGDLAAEIVDGKRKSELLVSTAAESGIPLAEVVAVGDGANDLPMLAKAGTGVAYHAKPVVREAASFRLNHCGLDALLTLVSRR